MSRGGSADPRGALGTLLTNPTEAFEPTSAERAEILVACEARFALRARSQASPPGSG